MSYWLFDLLALVVPLALLVAPDRARGGRRAWATALLLAAGAVAWTVPWDSHLVRTGVWTYDPERVLARVVAVPVEELAFVVLEVLLVTAWSLRVRALPAVRRGPAPGGGRATGAAGWAAVAALGLGLSLRGGGTTYLGLLLLWAGPPLALQRLVAGDVLRAHRRERLRAVLPVAVYLIVADRVALAAGTWSIAGATSTGLHLAGLPLEEGLFFLLTCVLVVDALLLASDPAVVARAFRLGRGRARGTSAAPAARPSAPVPPRRRSPAPRPAGRAPVRPRPSPPRAARPARGAAS